MHSLEVLEERSNEDNSPPLKKHRVTMGTVNGGNLSHTVSSSDTNFINTARKLRKATARKQSLSNGLITLNEITLTNQKQQD